MKQRIILVVGVLASIQCGGRTGTPADTPDAATAGSSTGSSGVSGSSGSGSGSGSSAGCVSSGTGASGTSSTGGSSTGSVSTGSVSTGSGSAGSGSATGSIAATGSSVGGVSAGIGPSAGSSTGGASDAGCLASIYDGGPRAAPAGHRAQAPECGRSTSLCVPDGGGGQICSSDADCAGDGSFNPFSRCLRGHCAIDQCLDDTDCPSTQACSCSSAYYGGNGCIHANLCEPASCHVDADCGPGGFCSPAAGVCGFVEGFYCHKPSDPCFDDTECAAVPGSLTGCVYSPEVGAFCCGVSYGCGG